MIKAENNHPAGQLEISKLNDYQVLPMLPYLLVGCEQPAELSPPIVGTIPPPLILRLSSQLVYATIWDTVLKGRVHLVTDFLCASCPWAAQWPVQFV